MSDYLADVQKYDSNANSEIVEKIVKHLGIALRSRDGSLVSTTDPKEVDRVRTSWIGKKLGITDETTANAAIDAVAQQMSADRTKHRVTFYYLTAKHLGKLNDL